MRTDRKVTSVLVIFSALTVAVTALHNHITIQTPFQDYASSISGLEKRKIGRNVAFLKVRGGSSSTAVAGDEDWDDEDEVELDPSLTKSTTKAASKLKRKKSAEVKGKVNSSIKMAKKKKKSTKKKAISTVFQKIGIPYIVRATLNPFTFLAMTRAYFASLFDINYLEDKVDSSQNLRSALEEKAKRSSGTGGVKKRKKSMRPGQAKTLSDLPKLNT